MSKKALGKGIGALFDETATKKVTVSPKNDKYIEVPVEQLIPNPYQPRKEFVQEQLDDLAASIREKGIIQPILVEKQNDDCYMIISGERRFRAAQLAGLKNIPAVQGKFSKEEKLENAIIENVQREDLSPLEEALGYKGLIEEFNLSQNDIAKKVGKKRSTIANALRLLKLPEQMLPSLSDGTLTPGHARAILACVNPADQTLLYNKIVEANISVRDAEGMASEFNNGKKAGKNTTKAKAKKIDPDIANIEQELIDTFGTKVQIKGNAKQGKIEISFFSYDDLERVLTIIKK